jgi:uncharacterized protein (DUF362 family)
MQRRDFIGNTVLGLAGLCVGVRSGLAGTKNKSPKTTPRPVAAEPQKPLAMVAVVTSPRIFKTDIVLDQTVLARMLADGVGALAMQDRPVMGWTSLFSAADVVGIKVDGSQIAAYRPQLVYAVAAELVKAGVKENHIIIFDHDDTLLTQAGFIINTSAEGVRCFGSEHAGYEEFPVVVDGVKARLSKLVTQQCTALINLPVLGPHSTAGMTGALLNCTGLAEKPETLMENGYVRAAGMAHLEAVRSKVRLVITDGLAVAFPAVPGTDTSGSQGGLLFSLDPVANDTIGFQAITGRLGLAPGDQKKSPVLPTCIERAATLGLGCNRADQIGQVRLVIP